MTQLPAERRVGYRDPGVWFGPLIWLMALGAGWQRVHQVIPAWSSVIWVAGIVLMETTAAVVAIRSRRGLTLAPDGIAWHKHEVFLPWSNVVAGVTGADARGARRFVVQVAEPDQALEGRSWFSGWEIRYNLKRHGGPIALKADRLATPAEQVTADIEWLKQEYVTAGGFKFFVDSPARPRRQRAARAARLWAALGSTGLGLILLSVVAGPQGPPGDHAQSSGGLTFSFHSRSGLEGYMDQVLSITNPSRNAVAPTLAFVPLDADGKKVPGITVRTAYGSDHGRVVIAPRSSASDVLAFDGPGYQEVVAVKAIVNNKTLVYPSAAAAVELHAQRADSSGKPVEPLQPFTTLTLVNPIARELAVRLVCIIWNQPPPGSPQQMQQAIPIGGLIKLPGLLETTVPVTEPASNLTQLCGSIKVYYSR